MAMAMALEPPRNKPAGRHALPTRRRKLVTEHGVRFARFGLIGGGVFIAGLALQTGLTSGLHIPAFLSYLIQTVLSLEVSFLLNRLFTWNERGASFWPSFWRYNVQKSITVVLNILAYAGLLRLGVNYIMANVVLTAIFTVVNYVGGDRFVFTPETGRP